jgi:hypothetical protein
MKNLVIGALIGAMVAAVVGGTVWSATSLMYLSGAAPTVGHVLTAADAIGGVQDGGAIYTSVRVVPGATDALTLADCGHAISYTSATAVALTTLNSLPVGCAIAVIQSAAGQVTVGPGAGSTLSSVNTYTKTKAQYAIIGLTVDANVGGTAAHFILSGDGA